MTEKKEIREQIVLIVEDNLSNYEIAKTFLNDMNICCESATDGIEALDMYETRGKATTQRYSWTSTCPDSTGSRQQPD